VDLTSVQQAHNEIYCSVYIIEEKTAYLRGANSKNFKKALVARITRFFILIVGNSKIGGKKKNLIYLL
jgi:hypothetical protein